MKRVLLIVVFIAFVGSWAFYIWYGRFLKLKYGHDTLLNLEVIRSAVSAYHKMHHIYPRRAEDLVPKYIDGGPPIKLVDLHPIRFVPVDIINVPARISKDTGNWACEFRAKRGELFYPGRNGGRPSKVAKKVKQVGNAMVVKISSDQDLKNDTEIQSTLADFRVDVGKIQTTQDANKILPKLLKLQGLVSYARNEFRK